MAKPSRKCRARVEKYVRDHFPDMRGVKPTISSRKYAGRMRHRFTFRKALHTSGGQSFKQAIHLAADEEGNVTKVSVSR